MSLFLPKELIFDILHFLLHQILLMVSKGAARAKNFLIPVYKCLLSAFLMVYTLFFINKIIVLNNYIESLGNY